MKEVTFSGRWLQKTNKVSKRGWSGWKIFSALAAAALIMVLLLSTAFAATATISQVRSSELGAQSPEDNLTSTAEPDREEETESAWIGHIRALKAEQQRVQAILEPERLKKAQEAENATLTSEEERRAQAIDFYLLEHGSPMTGYGQTFVKAGKTCGVDPALVVAIAGKESFWGKYCFLPYNAWGWGNSSWSSWEEAIENYTYFLGEEYIAKGLDTPGEMMPIYCPPSNGSWQKDVTTFYFELLALFSQSF